MKVSVYFYGLNILPTSTLLMAVYETEEIAQTAGALVQSFFKDVAHHVHDMIAFDGEVLVYA